MTILSTIQLTSPYQTRPLRFLHIANLKDWHVKVYGISAHQAYPQTLLVNAAEQLATEQLPSPAVWTDQPSETLTVSEDRYGVAILIVHEGREGNFVLLSWWVGENMLEHYVYFTTATPPFTFEPLANPHIIACVWELAVLTFERQAWVDTVLANPSGPNLEAYLRRQFSGDV